MDGVAASLPSDIEDEGPVGVDTHFDMRARLPVVHAGHKADPDAEADIDMDEALRTADFGDRDSPGKVEARRLRQRRW